MTFQIGREKTGGRKAGRPKGSISARAKIAKDLMEELNFDPLRALLTLAKSRKYPAEVRATWMRDALPYCHPRLSTTFVNSKIEKTSTVAHKLVTAAMNDPALAAAMEKLSIEASMLQRTADAESRTRALPAPDSPVDAEFVDLPPDPAAPSDNPEGA